MPTPSLLDDVLDAVLQTPLHRSLGVRLTDPSDATAGLTVDVQEATTTPMGVLHGGLHGLLIDVTSFLCLAARLPSGAFAATISSTVSILSAARHGQTVTTTARVDRLGGSTAFLSGEVRCGDEIIATAQLVKVVRRP